MFSEMQKARSRMRLAIGIIVLAAALGALALWTSGAISNWFWAGVMTAAGLGVIVFAWVVGIWLRNRQRRRLMDMRDSALW
jgi:peptidoglycan/LPS O-acetylase OafA/YrhL